MLLRVGLVAESYYKRIGMQDAAVLVKQHQHT
jgi:hypothetical protein